MGSPEPRTSERAQAVTIATQALDRMRADPDDDLAVLSRQFLRCIDRSAAAPSPVTGEAGLRAAIMAVQGRNGVSSYWAERDAETIIAAIRPWLANPSPVTEGPYCPTCGDSLRDLGPGHTHAPSGAEGAGPGMFWLDRIEDASGVSGTGRVAQGFVFEDGTVALRWLTEHRSTAIYSSLAEVEAIHGHNGSTRLVNAVPEGPASEVSEP